MTDHYAHVFDAVLAALRAGESFASVDDAIASAYGLYIDENPDADQ